MDVALLETPRLRLRPFTRTDVDALYAQWTEPEVRRYLWDGVVIAREQVAAVVEESIASFAERRWGMWVILPREGGAVVGFAGLRPIPARTDIELYYGLARASWGNGFATEAARAVLRYGFEVVGLDPIYLRTDGPNVASVAVMKRLGARYVGTDGSGAFGSTITYVLRRDAFAPAETPTG